MKSIKTRILCTAIMAITALFLTGLDGALAATGEEIERDAQRVLTRLYSKVPAAKALGEKAKAVLVFPSIKKAGLIVGGQYGEGGTFQKRETRRLL